MKSSTDNYPATPQPQPDKSFSILKLKPGVNINFLYAPLHELKLRGLKPLFENYREAYVGEFSSGESVESLMERMRTIRSVDVCDTDIIVDHVHKMAWYCDHYHQLRALPNFLPGGIQLDSKAFPTVKIQWTDHPEFVNLQLPLDQMNERFLKRDAECFYQDKGAVPHPIRCTYRINCIVNGNEIVYSNKQTLGNGEGGLIDFIKTETARAKDWDISKQPQIGMGKFVSYLEQHKTLLQLENALNKLLRCYEELEAWEIPLEVDIEKEQANARARLDAISQKRMELNTLPIFSPQLEPVKQRGKKREVPSR